MYDLRTIGTILVVYAIIGLAVSIGTEIAVRRLDRERYTRTMASTPMRVHIGSRALLVLFWPVFAWAWLGAIPGHVRLWRARRLRRQAEAARDEGAEALAAVRRDQEAAEIIGRVLGTKLVLTGVTEEELRVLREADDETLREAIADAYNAHSRPSYLLKTDGGSS